MKLIGWLKILKVCQIQKDQNWVKIGILVAINTLFDFVNDGLFVFC